MVYVPCYRFIRRKSETPLEVVWTIVPAIVLVVLSFILIESPAECMEGDPSASSYTSSSRLPPRVPHYHAIDDFLTQYGRELPESSLPPEPIPAPKTVLGPTRAEVNLDLPVLNGLKRKLIDIQSDWPSNASKDFNKTILKHMWCRYVDSNFATVDAELLTNSIMTGLSRTKGGITVAVQDRLHGSIFNLLSPAQHRELYNSSFKSCVAHLESSIARNGSKVVLDNYLWRSIVQQDSPVIAQHIAQSAALDQLADNVDQDRS
jgi:hypothetical protein